MYFFNSYTQCKKQMWEIKLLRSFFFHGNLLKYFNNFEHLKLQPYCAPIYFFGSYTQNKKQICGTKIFKEEVVFGSILLEYCDNFEHPHIQPYCLWICFQLVYTKYEINLWDKNLLEKIFPWKFTKIFK